MRKLGLVAVTLALVLGAGALPAAADGSEEVELFLLINDARQEAGLEPLMADIGLIASARGHTSGMVEMGELFHSSSGELTSYASDWELLGENVGRGPRVEAIHQAFMESESHRANVLGDFDRLGVGIARADDGTLFATVVFMRRSPDAPADDGATGTMGLISGLPEFAVSRLLSAVAVFERSNRELCSPLGSQGSACID
jgi:hypothetical protein